MSDITSKPYQPDPEKCCEGCVFGGPHAWWCPSVRFHFTQEPIKYEASCNLTSNPDVPK